MHTIDIDEDIRRARTLPADVYRDARWYPLQREKVFARGFHVVDVELPTRVGDVAPATLLPGCLDEPLVFTRTPQGVRCLSNVCTHRGNLVVESAGACEGLRCRYHGRRFDLDGRFVSMPEFTGCEAFPSSTDDLPKVAHGTLGPLVFASVQPSIPFDELIAPMRARLDAMPLDRLVFDREASRDYEVKANWALYCDNFLEGFHIPFVHAALNKVLDYGSYRTELFAHGSVQIGVAQDGDATFEVGPERVAGVYFWLFPSTMLNFYPWGLSLNQVVPLSHERTRVSYRSYVWDPSKRSGGAGGDLHRVELEDEAVVEAVQRGVRSRLYDRGRYSPTRELGVHHFHRLLARALTP